MRRTSLANVLLLLFSTLLAFLVVEVAFRFLQERKSKVNYTVADRSIYEYDGEFGYRYAPSVRATIATVREGALALYDTISVGPYGNLGDGTTSWGDEDVKIAVFGDSFTANPTGYHSWVEHIAEPLSSVTGKHVSVMNLARDGYGLVSIVHQAAKSIRELKPAMVILAFIADDLSRDRFWRTTVSVNGSVRLLVTTENSSSPNVQSAQDYMIIEPRVNAAWCADLLGKSASDGLIDELNGRFWVLQDESLKPGVVRYTSSMVLNRLRYGDPYFTLRKVPRMPRVSFSDFRENPEFVVDIQSLISQPAPVVFVMLPVYQDFVSGTIHVTGRHESLLASFLALVPAGIVNLLEVSEKPERPFERYFLLPHDPHPSGYGARWYATQMVEVIKKNLRDGPEGSLQQK